MEMSELKDLQEFFHLTRFLKSTVGYLGSSNSIFIVNFQFIKRDSSLIHDFTWLLLNTTIQHGQVLKQGAYFLQFLGHHQNFYATVLALIKVLLLTIQDFHTYYNQIR